MEDDIVSYFPISIGTGIALQTICGIDEKGAGTGPAPVLSYDVLMVNLRTVYRNYHMQLSPAERDSLNPVKAMNAMNTDIRVIVEAVQDYSNKSCQVVLYSNDHKSAEKRFPNAKIKHPRTDLQVMYSTYEKKTIEALYERRDDFGLVIQMGDMELPEVPEGAKVLILTHMPVDLLNPGKWPVFELLESHTGKIKAKPEWNTKIAVDKENVERIPFNRVTLQLFGDKGTMFSPLPIKLRRGVVELAAKNRWTSQTTESRMKFSLKEFGDPIVRDDVLKLF